MALSDRYKASTRRAIVAKGEAVSIRRYSGTGEARSSNDTATTAFVTDDTTQPLSGSATQRRIKAVVLMAELAAIMPVTTADRLVAGAKEFTITHVGKRRVGGESIALDILAVG